MIRIFYAHFSPVRMCANLPFFVLFLPASRNLARLGYEIFSQFFHDRPDVFSLPISRGVLQEERIRPSLNDFTTRYTETPSLQRTYIWMRMLQEGSFGQNRFEDQRPRGLEATRVKCTWSMWNLVFKDRTRKLTRSIRTRIIGILGTQISAFEELQK